MSEGTTPVDALMNGRGPKMSDDDDLFENEIERGWLARGGRLIFDWGIAALLAIFGFWAIGVWRSPELPENAPNWELTDLNGVQYKLSDLHGKTVVLNFWAEWCGPCKMEIPTFSDFAEENPDVVVLGAAVDGTEASLKRAVKSLDIRYPVVRASQSVQRAYGVETLPTTVIIDGEGKVRSAHVGMMLGPQLSWATR